jgi:colicin import membrane protein
MRLLIAGLALLILQSAAGAADPDDVKEIKKRVADLRERVAKSEENVKSALAADKAITGELKRKREAVAVVTKAAAFAADQAVAAPEVKSVSARKVADKAEAEAADADKVLGAAKNKLKTATDPTEVANLKKTVADLTAAADEKRTAAAAARSAAKEAAAELEAATAAAKATVAGAVRAGDEVVKLAQADVKKADDILAAALDERDLVERQFRKAIQRLKELEGK